MVKKQKTSQKKKKKNTKHFLKVKNVFEKLFEKLTRDIIECCKLPKTIELRKKLGYNHNDIMV